MANFSLLCSLIALFVIVPFVRPLINYKYRGNTTEAWKAYSEERDFVEAMKQATPTFTQISQTDPMFEAVFGQLRRDIVAQYKYRYCNIASPKKQSMLDLVILKPLILVKLNTEYYKIELRIARRDQRGMLIANTDTRCTAFIDLSVDDPKQRPFVAHIFCPYMLGYYPPFDGPRNEREHYIATKFHWRPRCSLKYGGSTGPEREDWSSVLADYMDSCLP